VYVYVCVSITDVADDKIRLYWKFEDGPDDAEDADPRDVGPAWLDYPDGREEKVEKGKWITRETAQKLAADQGYELQLDE